MGIYNSNGSEPKYVEEMKREQAELFAELNNLAEFLNEATFNFYRSLLYFEISAWDEEQEKYGFKIDIFGKIINFNLKYYPAEVVRKKCSGLGLNCYESDFYEERIIECYGKKIASIYPIELNKNSLEQKWNLTIGAPYTYDKEFNKKRLAVLKEISDELRKRGAWYNDTVMEEIEEGIRTQYPHVSRSEDTQRVFDVLAAAYKITIPKTYDLKAPSILLPDCSTEELEKLETTYGDTDVFEHKTIVQNTKTRKITLVTPMTPRGF